MPSVPALTTLLLLPAAILASFDCNHIRVDKQSFNLEKLGGPKDVHFLHRTSPTVSNTTFTIDICKALKYPADVPKGEKCPGGTRVCGIERDYNGHSKEGFFRQAIPIAGEYHLSEGRKLNPQFTRIKGGKSNSDSKKEGLIAELHGGMHDKTPQKAIIEFQCDPEMEGTEGFEEDKTRSLSATSFDSYGSMGKRNAADDDDDDGGEEDDSPLPDLDEGKALQYVSYELEKENTKVLRLNWKTKYACEGAKAPDSGSGKKTAGWGFFTWFLIIVFLLVAAYIIFGSWLNYNRYGARGWDLLPHGDAIRDLPYLVKDWSGSVVDKLKGGSNSRGGYSAV